MASTTPIRVAIIGLSSSAATGWASRAHLPYLLSPQGRSHFRIVALCNSSVEAAKRAIAHYKLDEEAGAAVKAYGNPAELAKDADVDLVVCTTRVDVHYDTIRDSVAAGRDVFVEWPLAGNIEQVRELVHLAKQHKDSTTVIGTQGRVSPPAEKVKELLKEGRIGKVLSSEFRAYGGLGGRDEQPSFLRYFADRSIGGNVYTIGFGHLFDTINAVLGTASSLNSQLAILRPQVKILDYGKGGVVTEVVTSDVPDYVMVTGVLPGSSTVAAGATLFGRFRRGPPFPGEPGLVWSINGEKGEIRLTAPGGASLGVSAYADNAPVDIEVEDFASKKVEKIEWSWEDWQAALPIPARNIGELYEIYANKGKDRLPGFEQASILHEQLEKFLQNWDATKD